MWKTTTDPVARPAIRNLNQTIIIRSRFFRKYLLLVVWESKTSDAWVASRESVEKSKIESAPHLSWWALGFIAWKGSWFWLFTHFGAIKSQTWLGEHFRCIAKICFVDWYHLRELDFSKETNMVKSKKKIITSTMPLSPPVIMYSPSLETSTLCKSKNS